jgi:hypothetical protein
MVVELEIKATDWSLKARDYSVLILQSSDR